MSKWVVDTPPLILLAKLDRLELLKLGATEVYIPSAVLAEITAYQDIATERIQASIKQWLTVVNVQNQQLLQRFLTDLDQGEAEVIALAQEVKADFVILDDLDARLLCRTINQKTVGTLGILLGAKQKGLIPSLKAEVEKLQQFGLWVSDALVKAILEAAGENTNN